MTIEIPQMAGVDEAFLQALNDRLRRLDQSSTSSAARITGTRLERGDRYRAAGYPEGAIYRETDTSLIYQAAWFQGVQQWVYVGGTLQATFANRPTGLGKADTGLLWAVSDYAHLLRWDGAGWDWVDAEGGYFTGRDAAPSGPGWALCDGSATSRLTITAGAVSETAVTPPNLSTANAIYMAWLNAYGAVTSTTAATGVGSIGLPPGLGMLPYYRR